MKRIKNNQAGFGILPVILIVVIVAIIGVTGWYVYKSVKNTNSTLSSTVNTQSTIATKSTAKENTPATAADIVQVAFNNANDYSKSKGGGLGEINQIQNSLSSDLYSKLTNTVKSMSIGGYDPVLCDQASPTSLRAVAVLNSSTSKSATVSVNENYGATTQTVTATVDLPSLKITSITCPNQ